MRLPYAPMQVTFDPRGTCVLVATLGGVSAWVFDGQTVRPVAGWSLSNLAGATGAAWGMDGCAFVVSTASEVAVYGLRARAAGYDATRVAAAPFAGTLGLAPGPAGLPSALLAATATGATLLEAQGSTLVALPGGPSGLTANLGVAATTDGSVAATWQQEAVQLWARNGTAYAPAAAWDPPVPPVGDGPVVSVALAPQSDG